MENLLLQIALEEKLPKEVLRWLEQLEKRNVRLSERTTDEVAGALKRAYPDRAVTLWKGLAEAQIALTKVSAYEVAGRYLHKAKPLMTGTKKKEWEAYLAGLREKNRRKPRCVQVLDRIAQSSRRIVDD